MSDILEFILVLIALIAAAVLWIKESSHRCDEWFYQAKPPYLPDDMEEKLTTYQAEKLKKNSLPD